MYGFTIVPITKAIKWSDLKDIARDGYVDMVKAVVDINIRPSQNNRSRGFEDEKLRKKTTGIVQKLIKDE